MKQFFFSIIIIFQFNSAFLVASLTKSHTEKKLDGYLSQLKALKKTENNQEARYPYQDWVLAESLLEKTEQFFKKREGINGQKRSTDSLENGCIVQKKQKIDSTYFGNPKKVFEMGFSLGQEIVEQETSGLRMRLNIPYDRLSDTFDFFYPTKTVVEDYSASSVFISDKQNPLKQIKKKGYDAIADLLSQYSGRNKSFKNVEMKNNEIKINEIKRVVSLYEQYAVENVESSIIDLMKDQYSRTKSKAYAHTKNKTQMYEILAFYIAHLESFAIPFSDRLVENIIQYRQSKFIHLLLKFGKVFFVNKDLLNKIFAEIVPNGDIQDLHFYEQLFNDANIINEDRFKDTFESFVIQRGSTNRSVSQGKMKFVLASIACDLIKNRLQSNDFKIPIEGDMQKAISAQMRDIKIKNAFLNTLFIHTSEACMSLHENEVHKKKIFDCLVQYLGINLSDANFKRIREYVSSNQERYSELNHFLNTDENCVGVFAVSLEGIFPWYINE